MNAYRVKPLKYPWTPFIYLAAVLAAIHLNRIAPLEIPGTWLLPLEVLGIIFCTMALWIAAWGYRKLLQSRTALLSSSPATHLVTSGPFRYTRNPVYLGYTLATLGAGMIMGNGWLIIASALTVIVIHAWIIRSEEKHLLARFGFEFECYCRRTRAWI